MEMFSIYIVLRQKRKNGVFFHAFLLLFFPFRHAHIYLQMIFFFPKYMYHLACFKEKDIVSKIDLRYYTALQMKK